MICESWGPTPVLLSIFNTQTFVSIMTKVFRPAPPVRRPEAVSRDSSLRTLRLLDITFVENQIRLFWEEIVSEHTA